MGRQGKLGPGGNREKERGRLERFRKWNLLTASSEKWHLTVVARLELEPRKGKQDHRATSGA